MNRALYVAANQNQLDQPGSLVTRSDLRHVVDRLRSSSSGFRWC